MSYTQEQIDRANQVNLEQFLRSQGRNLSKAGESIVGRNTIVLPSTAIAGSVTVRIKAASHWIL